jgi:hypothetical protein
LANAPFDASAFNYALQEGSPAVNFGNNTYAQSFALDYLNSIRIQQGTVDCGAIESPYTDTQAPVASCIDTSIYLNNNGIALLDSSLVNNNSSDNIGITSYLLSQTAFECSAIGENTITLTVSDAAGNTGSCSAIITVIDTIRPAISAHNVSVYLNNSGNATISVNDINNGTTDNCGIDSLFVSPSQFTCADIGNNSVTFTAVDINGNHITLHPSVTVIDSVYPTAIAQDLTLYLYTNGTATVTANQVNNGSSDDCGIATMSLSHTNFSCNDIGANQITFSVHDHYGNVSSVNATITVLDTIHPVTNGHDILLNLQDANPAIITPAAINNGSYDNCTFNQSISQSSFTAIGIYTIQLISTDLSGNSSSKSYTVEVIDSIFNELPEINTLNVSVLPNPTTGKIQCILPAITEQLEIQITDISGKIILEKRIPQSDSFELDVDGKSGFYILKIRTRENEQTIKLLKY